MLGWLRERRRNKIREEPFPGEWLEILEKNVPHYASLSPDEQAKLRGDLRIFIVEKYWEGCAGLALTDEILVTVSAQACLLSLHLDNDYYPDVRSLFIYPHGYLAEQRSVGPAGVVTEGRIHRLGEAWSTGPVVLSWDDARDGSLNPRDGRNVVFHEFAHQLDMADRRSDGMPRLPDDEAYRRWIDVVTAEYEALVRRSAAGRASVLDEYGVESYAEFFAVATEAFFERPLPLRARHQRLYELLRDYYQQDPAARMGMGC